MANNTPPNFDPNTQTEVRIRRPGRAPEYVVLQGDVPVRVTGPLKRTSLMPDSEVTAYRSHNVYIVDDKDRNGDAPQSRRDGRLQYPEDKCDQIHITFTVYFGGNCHVRSVRFSTHAGPNQLTRYFEREFRERKFTSEDLVIIYYHGKAGGNGVGYAWETFSCPARAQNVHDLFTFVNGTTVDCLFLLDAFMPTHYAENLKRYGQVTEIIQSGKNLQTPDEVLIPGRSNFTETLTSTLTERVKEVDRHFKSWKARKTFPELMAKDVAICSHPIRKNTNRTWADSNQVVRRLAVCPKRIRRLGYLDLVVVRLQGRRNTSLPTPPGSDDKDDGVDASFDVSSPSDDRQDADFLDIGGEDDGDANGRRVILPGLDEDEGNARVPARNGLFSNHWQLMPTSPFLRPHSPADGADLDFKQEFPDLFLPASSQSDSSRKRKHSMSRDGSRRSESPDDLFVTQRSDSEPTGGLNASQREIIRSIEASGTFARGEDGENGEDGGFSFLESIAFAGRTNEALDQDDLQMSQGFGATDEDEELFLF